jgi:hypothetical protein
VDEWYLSPWIDSKSLVGAVLQAIAEAWKIPLKKVLEEIDPYRMVRQPLPEVGKRGDETMYLPATIIKKPKE